MIYVTESRASSEGNTGFCLKKKFLARTSMRTVGLCHSVQHTSKQLAGYLEVPYEELQWRCAGINHNAWFTQLHYQEQDMYPRLRERARIPEVYERDPVRFEAMLHFAPLCVAFCVIVATWVIWCSL
ncbi:MAG: hypothetical protein ACJ8CB_15345 [Ktedonobacteraceae bacterium]